MKRRTFILASGAWAALACTRVAAQSLQALRRIAFLLPSTREFSKPQLDAFTARLKELGYAEGRDIAIEKRWADGSIERLPALARELLALKPEVILAPTSAVAAAFKKETSTVPVVFIAVANPDGLGFVASLARPGGNMTGLAFRGQSMTAKLIEMVRETLPAARRIALLDIEGNPNADKFRSFYLEGFAALGFEVDFVAVKQAEEFERAFARITTRKAEVLYVTPYPLFVSHARKLGELSMQARLPMVGPRRAFTDAGGLLSYDNDLKEDYRGAAVFVHKILNGARPADLPVEQPDRFHLAVNMRSAKALGIKIPQSVLLRADEVIE